MRIGGQLHLYASARDITDRKQAEEAVIKAKAAAQTSERQAKLLNEKLNEAQQIAEIGSWDWDLRTNTVWWSDETFRIFGVRPDEHIPSAGANARFYHPDDLEPFGRQVEHSLETGEALDMDLRLVLRQGVTKHCHVRACVVAELSGKPIRFAGTIMDTTVRKKVEEALESSLQEKEALLKELHHRVKNNLQVITSPLRMEARRSEYLATKSVLDEMKNRVLSMALLHESLYRTGTFASVDLGA